MKTTGEHLKTTMGRSCSKGQRTSHPFIGKRPPPRLLHVEGSPQSTIRSAQQLGTGFTPDARPDATLAFYLGLGPALHPVAFGHFDTICWSSGVGFSACVCFSELGAEGYHRLMSTSGAGASPRGGSEMLRFRYENRSNTQHAAQHTQLST